MMSFINHSNSAGPFADYRYIQFANSEDVVLYSHIADVLVRVPW